MTHTMRQLLTLAAAAVAVAVLAPSAQAAPQPAATREQVARVVVERLLLADVEAADRGDYLVRDDCFGDGSEFTNRKYRLYACFLADVGVMGDTGRNAAYPTFEPQAPLRRDQAASVMARVANGEPPAWPERAGFIDVTARNPHRHAVGWAAYHGIVFGYDTQPPSFKPARPVSRGQVLTMAERVRVYWGLLGQPEGR